MPARRRDEEGFTLVELVVVLVLISILAAIAIPLYLSQRRSAQDAAAVADLRGLATSFVDFTADGQPMSAAVLVNQASTRLTRLGVTQAATVAPQLVFSGTGDGSSEGVDIYLGEPVAEGELCLVSTWSGSNRWHTFSLTKGGLQPGVSDTYPDAVALCQGPPPLPA